MTGAPVGVWLFIIGAAVLVGWGVSMVVQAFAAWLAVRDPLSIRDRWAKFPNYDDKGDD